MPKEVIDQLPEAVDPYNESKQREQFLRMAGVDNELDRDEFVAAKKAEEDSFAKPFDVWLGLAKFDNNKNGTVDWVEFHEYRKAVLAVLIKHHDKDKDGKLIGDERIETNKALAGRKLLGYLDVSCCGGEQEHDRKHDQDDDHAQAERRLKSFKESKDKAWSDRHRLAMADTRLIAGRPESELMPYSELMSRGDLDRELDLYYRASLAGEMPEGDWELLKTHTHRMYEWLLAENTDALTYAMEIDSYFNTGKPGKRLRGRNATLAFPGRVHRLGFTRPAVTVERGNPNTIIQGVFREFYGGETLEDLDREYTIITVNAAGRFTPGISLMGDPQYRDIPDEYRKIVMRFVYDPTNPYGQPFLTLRDANLLDDHIDESKIAEYWKAPGEP